MSKKAVFVFFSLPLPPIFLLLFRQLLASLWGKIHDLDVWILSLNMVISGSIHFLAVNNVILFYG